MEVVVAVLVLAASALFILNSMAEAIVAASRGRAARQAEEEAQRNWPEPPAVERVSFRTLRNVNHITMPARRGAVRIGDVCLLGEYERMLQRVDASVPMEHYTFLGAPAFWRMEGPGVIALWPIPDGSYDLSAALFSYESGGCAEPVYIATPRVQRAAVTATEQASIKSLQLLLSWLTPVQKKSLVVDNYFTVIGSVSGARYRIHLGTVYNVMSFNLIGDANKDLCFQPAGAPLPGDIMLAQKLTLETNEAEALRVANLRASCHRAGFADSPVELRTAIRTLTDG